MAGKFPKLVDWARIFCTFRVQEFQSVLSYGVIRDMSSIAKISGALVILAFVLASAVTAFAEDKGRKNRFVPQNDNYRASGERAASQGSSPECCPADLNCDGVVNGADLGLELGFWTG